jgi:ABC-2 type transport system permease protein
MNSAFQVSGQNFREYYFPGTMMLILLFTAIFATISIIEDRREGFLQGVLVSPIPRWSMVLGKIMGGALIATLQGLIFLALALTLGIRFHVGTGLLIVAWLLISSVGLTGLGFVLAWRMDSTQGFHAIMNLLLMPMWLLSGAFFPIPRVSEGTGWGEQILHLVMRCNPVTYAVAGLRRLLYRDTGAGEDAFADIWLPGLGISTCVLLSFAIIMCACAWRMSCRHTSGDLL